MAGRDAAVTIKITENKMRALANYTPSVDDGQPLTVEDIMNKIEARGIKTGIKADTIKKMCESERPIPSVVIAEAIPPEVGENARIETFVNVDQKSKAVARDDGSIDYRDLGEVCSAVKDQKLFQKIPPTYGKPGIDVLGDEIPGLPGRDLKVFTGPGTKLDENDPNIVRAAKDGEVLVISGVMEISEIHSVAGDVDYESGNIKFKGSVKIKGTVKSGFKVEADGDIEIGGNVEDAEVIGKNDIFIRGGCAGTGNGSIQAGRDVFIKFVENQTIRADRDIIIGGDSLHSNLFAGRSVIAKGRKSMIVGGNCEAKVSVEAARFGSIACAPTIIKVGIDPKLAERMQNTEEEITKTKESQEKIEKSIIFLYKLKIDGKGKLPPDKAKLLKKLESAKKSMPEKLETLEKYKVKLSEEQKDIKSAYAVSNISVFPKVKVFIGNQWISIEDNLGPSQFRMVDSEVTRLSK